MFQDEVEILEIKIDQWKNGYITNEDLRNFVKIWIKRTSDFYAGI
jgi:hypothetical protein